ncbi:hypothetical protein YQE_08641, partial [Dendroctonus ponderosae]
MPKSFGVACTIPTSKPLDLWEEVKRRIRTQLLPNKQALMNKISEIWTNFPQNFVQKSIASIPRRRPKCYRNLNECHIKLTSLENCTVLSAFFTRKLFFGIKL